ncbi:hypothetical protein [Sinorhizobium terangae]|uniref:Uncharacterized protein n=1 Tax=Sinorhizobium terangae TaxID=110322 RepID=A0A6N7LMA1_SINTE|nr:hypothetical protein [Sinorhizobium terangae]MBB4189324.1 hypothetical protein [Sinorhizobium terangae]MQX18990.1 hypothetical protein [Sinorhizobium terangae]MQX19003.1 hypothetical protein [Sinorhizobium terangae]WFU49555.1 hypothetical protein QA637_09245 [Sinorhizobium terangae]
MTSKAHKLRAKRKAQLGRPRKVNAARFACGKIRPEWSRQESEKEMIAVALAARKRMHGLDTTSAFAGYTLGRLFLDGRITAEQREAGDDYAVAMARYYHRNGIAYPSVRAQALDRVAGHPGETTEERARIALKAADRMMRLDSVLSGCAEGRQVKTTVFNVCVMDYEGLRLMPEPQLAWLKRGLNALLFDKGLREYGEGGALFEQL